MTISKNRFTFRFVLQKSEHEDIKQFHQRLQKRGVKPKLSWIPLFLLLGAIGMVIILSLFSPQIATYILMGIPIISSVHNLLGSKFEKRGRKK